MILIGFDPGVRRVGYSVIDCDWVRGISIRELGVWNLLEADQKSMGLRLERLYQESYALLEKWNPRWIGLEKAISFKGLESSLKLSEARGVLRLACYQTLEEADQRLIELSPTAIKKNTTGWGRSSKSDMIRSLEIRFQNLEEWVKNSDEKLSHDAYDALGIAWTTWVQVRQKLRMGSRTNKSVEGQA
jgi:crossover junction endodeoxyribonuclease RuvC